LPGGRSLEEILPAAARRSNRPTGPGARGPNGPDAAGCGRYGPAPAAGLAPGGLRLGDGGGL